MHEAHIFATWLHIISAIFWIGAVLFIMTILGPIVRRQSPGTADSIMPPIQARVRFFVLIAIITFLVTGIFNMHYRGLMSSAALLESPFGRTFLIKMIPAAIMFTIYFSAPFLMKRLSPVSKPACCEGEGSPTRANKIFAMLHVIVIACGLLTVFFGVRLRG